MKKITIISVFMVAFALLANVTVSSQSTHSNPVDYSAIQNELAKWNQLQDDGNLEGFMKLWAKSPSFKNPFGEFNSAEEIMAFEQNYLNGFAKGKRHLTSNTLIVSMGEYSAMATVDLMVVEVKEIPFIVATVRADISLVKENGSWKFKSVILSIDEGFNKLMESQQEG